MKKIIVLFGSFLISTTLAGQSAKEVISKVFQAQRDLKRISYTLIRRDTLVTDDVRTMTGNVIIAVDPVDGLFGFKFRAKLEGESTARIYDGHMGYDVNLLKKTYVVTSDVSDYFLVNGGGQIVMNDLVKLDTTKAIRFELAEDTDNYKLTMIYADLSEYNVVRRSKAVKIRKKTMLPVAVKRHQETLGKVQDLDYQIQTLSINDTSSDFNFSSIYFLKGYNQEITPQSTIPALDLKDRTIPVFALSSFDNKNVTSSELRGKVVLIDFWEVWCGPCIESMPKVQHLFDSFKDKGLLVYGITNETKSLEAARRLVKIRGISYPMLIGGEQIKKDFSVSALPLYLIIDKTGKIIFVSPGYSDKMEAVIRDAL